MSDTINTRYIPIEAGGEVGQISQVIMENPPSVAADSGQAEWPKGELDDLMRKLLPVIRQMALECVAHKDCKEGHACWACDTMIHNIKNKFSEEKI